MFLYHGEEDPMITPETAAKSYEELSANQLDFTFEKEPGLTHSLSMPEIKKIGAFLRGLMV